MSETNKPLSTPQKIDAIHLQPDDHFAYEHEGSASGQLIIACGALAREMLALIKQNKWFKTRLHCLPAILHNHPHLIPERLAALIAKERRPDERVIVVYSHCGANGEIEAVAKKAGADYIGGAHCFQLFAGEADFNRLMDEAPGTFFLTDFLARHFDVFVVKSLGLDKNPALAKVYFGNYKRLVYLAQTENEALQKCAREAADKLGLDYHYQFTGYGHYAPYLQHVCT